MSSNTQFVTFCSIFPRFSFSFEMVKVINAVILIWKHIPNIHLEHEKLLYQDKFS